MNRQREESSFRDPHGFIFFNENKLYRQVNRSYQQEYDLLLGSGLYQELVDDGLLVEHSEADLSLAATEEAYRVIAPRPVEFISYPHEWSFSQLKDAALVTLAIQKRALAKGMSLKDCSAFNVQFDRGKPVFIDTLSFERYPEGKPWTAYRQFCQHFLAPLALMSLRDVRLSQLFRVYIDGIPLDLASSLLPLRSRFSFGLLTHIHLHARYQRRYQGEREKPGSRKKVGLNSLRGIIDSLESTVNRLKWEPGGTEWAEYYDDTNYTEAGLKSKDGILDGFLKRIPPGMVWDLGANTGRFSRIAADRGNRVISFDIDPAAVDRNYRETKGEGREDILPLLLDLTNPSPAMGWGGVERMSLAQRGPADTVLALALIHHLAISNNLPFGKIAAYMAELGEWLIMEFVPKSDSQIQRLLVCREDIFDNYRQESFESDFRRYFEIEDDEKIMDSKRTLYLMRRKKQI